MKRFFAILITAALLLTAIPFTLSVTASSDEVTIAIEGKNYTAHIGDIVHYTYSIELQGIDLGEGSKENRLTEIQGSLFFNEDNLRFLTSLKPDDEDGHYLFLPKLLSGNITASTERKNRLSYNAINLGGYLFKTKKVLLTADFEITGAEDLYITNHIENLGSGSAKLIYLGQTIIAPKVTIDVQIENPNAQPTDPPTEQPTAAPTQPPTEKPTEAPVYTYKDSATGISVKTRIAATLVVREVPLSEPYYVASDAECNTMYDIKLMRGNTEVKPAEPVQICIPLSKKNMSVYAISQKPELSRINPEIMKEYNIYEGVYFFNYIFDTAQTGRFLITTSKNELKLHPIGDSDLDGYLMILDATAIQRALSSIIKFTRTSELAADFDGDGYMSILDATAIQRKLVGLYYDDYRKN